MGDQRLEPRSGIGRLRVVHTVPDSAPQPGVARQALAASLGEPLRLALDERFRQLQAGDPDAIWLIRSLPVAVTLPLTVRDPPAVAARLADAVERAVLATIRSGDTADCVRFDHARAYVAAFVRAVLAGADHAWLFDRLAPARRLPPAQALTTAARLEGCPLAAVIAELAAQEAWAPLVLRLTEPEAVGLLGAVVRSVPDVPPPGPVRAAVAAMAVEAVSSGVRTVAQAHLLVLGRSLVELGGDASVVAAAVLEGRALAPGPVAADRPEARPASASPVPHLVGQVPSRPRAEPTAFRSAGAAAFILATSFEDVALDLGLGWLLDDADEAALVRADVLARVLNIDGGDPAVAVCAGIRHPDVEPDPDLGRAVASATAAVPVPERDLEWLTTGRAPAAGAAALAEELARRFLRRLVGFQASPLDYVVPRLFGPSGTVVLDATAIGVEIVRPPLLVVLQLAGLADFVATYPWLEEPVMIRHEEPV